MCSVSDIMGRRGRTPSIQALLAPAAKAETPASSWHSGPHLIVRVLASANARKRLRVWGGISSWKLGKRNTPRVSLGRKHSAGRAICWRKRLWPFFSCSGFLHPRSARPTDLQPVLAAHMWAQYWSVFMVNWGKPLGWIRLTRFYFSVFVGFGVIASSHFLSVALLYCLSLVSNLSTHCSGW